MFKTITFLLRGFIKSPRVNNQVEGFTLIELLIALTMAFLILTPLLGLVVNIATTDQKEQAKATSEQEIQTAMDFIARDLQQAVYIYDDRGVEKTNSPTNPLESGIKDSLPVVTNGLPVLVFWKREIVKEVIPNDGAIKDDAFRYSLVAYYLITNTNNTDKTWSKTARIARWEIKDGVRSININVGEPCTDSYNKETKFVSKEYCPDDGFVPFDLDSTSGNVTQKMKLWKGDKTKYKATPQVLIDYIDQTIPETPTGNIPDLTRQCLTDYNITTSTTSTSKQPKVIPSNTTSPSSFYACVSNYEDSTKIGQVITTAQVFIRANALARVQSSDITYSDKNKATYFPSVNTIVQARGFLYTK
ncbi:hormogonium polysaccharide secretion pseudopilin HpsC [Anabaena sp. PCC 7108]|uniref:hormogonium polysaccharide secretion pseudopilin HpsC n=1 Tax=Anabaena sp. PCC 7108 TaxID=163908 RepID=UPI0003472163|nr:hormogonium polysaccharide secretion pseudopilin HpsC [Anabaena sp. PCC 7108]